MFKRILSLTVIICFFLTTLGPLPKAHANTVLGLPTPGTMVNLSPAYEPALIKGLTVHKDNPFLFDFIVDTGNSGIGANELKKEGDRLVKYFFACLTIPEKDLWVNLSPYEKDRMVPQALGQTALGRDLLAEDYILKQLTASLIYPEKNLGKVFWDRVYAKARQMYGTTQIPVNTFNKVWILADKAIVYEHGQTAFVVSGHLKVMLEEDYLALKKHTLASPLVLRNDTSSIGANIVREIVIPEIEKEVNIGKNFSTLRQVFNSLILATWYKKNLKEALLTQVYANKSTVKGVNLADPSVKEQIYQQYLKAYKKGVFNYIKEDAQPDGQTIPRKYFSGGFGSQLDEAMKVDKNSMDAAEVAGSIGRTFGLTVGVGINGANLAANPSPMANQAMLALLRRKDKYEHAYFYGDFGTDVYPETNKNLPRMGNIARSLWKEILGGKGFGLFDMSSPETDEQLKNFIFNTPGSLNRIEEQIRQQFDGNVNRSTFENEFTNGGEIFDELMANGYFRERKGMVGHPQSLAFKRAGLELDRKYPALSGKIWTILQAAADEPAYRDSLIARLHEKEFLDNVAFRTPPGFTITTEQTRKWDEIMSLRKNLRPGQKDPVEAIRNNLIRELKRQGIDVAKAGSYKLGPAAKMAIDERHLDGLSVDLVKALFEDLKVVESKRGKLGAEEGMPFLTAVRSGAALSMPGMMDTILNLGLNEASVRALADATNPKFAWDSYRRFIEMFGRTVLEIEENEKTRTGFKYVLEDMVKEKKVESEYDLDANDYQELVRRYKAELEGQSKVMGRSLIIPDNPYLQFLMAVQTVMRSTFNKRAMDYRQKDNLKLEQTLSAVNTVPMAFGNRNDLSGSGVFFTRDLQTGEKRFNLEFAFNAQGEDVVSGRKAGKSLKQMLASPNSRDVALELLVLGSFTEYIDGDVQDIEFTFEHDETAYNEITKKNGKTSLYILQKRSAKRTAMANVRVAYEMAMEKIQREKAAGTLTPARIKQIREEAVKSINAAGIGDLLVARFDPDAKKKAIKDGKLVSQVGLNASPGAAVGRIVLDAETAIKWPETHLDKNGNKEKVILIREETSPEDLFGMLNSEAILTTKGGRTSHAAVVARQFGKPAVVNITNMNIDFNKRTVTFTVKNPDGTSKTVEFKEGDYIAVDGTGEGEFGQVFKVEDENDIPMIPSIVSTQQNLEQGVLELNEMIVHLEALKKNLGDSPSDLRLKSEYDRNIAFYNKKIDEFKSKTLTKGEEAFYKMYKILLQWANDIRGKAPKDKKALGAGTNSEEPDDVLAAVLNGAQRIGLVRTEHMFKDVQRRLLFQKMILSKDENERNKILEDLGPYQRSDFLQIFLLLKGKSATIRLLDPPLHEFLPSKPEHYKQLARFNLGFDIDLEKPLSADQEERVQAEIKKLKVQVEDYKEDNPMIGTRGVRLGVLMPQLMRMQAKAIFEAMLDAKAEGMKKTKPEIMVPLVGNVEEFRFIRDIIVKVAESLGIERNEYKVGTMIEIIAGAENALAIAREADFFSFGTNDLTQTGLALSRDDGKEFLEVARLTGVFEADPFVSLIKEVAEFMKRATLPVRADAEMAKRISDKLFSFGVCGEQGVDVKSIKDHMVKYLDYVSGNSNRIPGAIFASAQEVLAGNSRVEGVEMPKPEVKMKSYDPILPIQNQTTFMGKVMAAVRFVNQSGDNPEIIRSAIAQLKIPEDPGALKRLTSDENFWNSDAYKTLLGWVQGLGIKSNHNKDGRIPVQVMTSGVTQNNLTGTQGVGLVTTEEILKSNSGVRASIQEYLLAVAADHRKDEQEKLILDDLRAHLGEALHGLLGTAGGHRSISVRLPSMSLYSLFEEEKIPVLAQQLGISIEEAKRRMEKYHESNPEIGERGSRVFFKKVAPFYIELVHSLIMAAHEQQYRQFDIVLPFINNGKQVEVIMDGDNDAYGNIVVPSLRKEIESTVKTINEHVSDDTRKIEVNVGAIIEIPSAITDVQEIAKQAPGQLFINADTLTMTVWAAVARDVSRDKGFLKAYLKAKLWSKDYFRFAPPEVRNLVIEAVQKIKAQNPGRKISLIGSNSLDVELMQAAHFAGVDSLIFPDTELANSRIRQLANIAAAIAALNVEALSYADAAMSVSFFLNSVQEGDWVVTFQRMNGSEQAKLLSGLAEEQQSGRNYELATQALLAIRRAMPMVPRGQSDAATLAKSVQPLGGIDLNSANMGMTITRDANGGVKVNFDPAMIERIKAQGVFSADPFIIRITPMSPAQISPLLGLQVPAQTESARV